MSYDKTRPILDDDDCWQCPACGDEMGHEQCWQCHGVGGFHDCGEDCCPCLDKDEITDDCEECRGNGAYPVCPNAGKADHGRTEANA